MINATNIVAVSSRPKDGTMRRTGMTSGDVKRRMPCASGLRKSARNHGIQKRSDNTSRYKLVMVLIMKTRAKEKLAGMDQSWLV
jgi:hypothetical protein